MGANMMNPEPKNGSEKMQEKEPINQTERERFRIARMKPQRLTSEQVFEILKVMRPALPISYHPRYENDHVMMRTYPNGEYRGMPQIILNNVQFFTPRHASLLADTPYCETSEEWLASGRLDAHYGLTLQTLEQYLSTSNAWTKYGNTYMTHGCDFCDCGSKYWVNDTCVSCGFKFDIYKHRNVAPQVNNVRGLDESQRGKMFKEVAQ